MAGGGDRGIIWYLGRYTSFSVRIYLLPRDRICGEIFLDITYSYVEKGFSFVSYLTSSEITSGRLLA